MGACAPLRQTDQIVSSHRCHSHYLAKGGDLRAMLATLQSLLRGYDLLSRYADRLVVVGLPETDAAETRRIAARLLRALETSNQESVRRLSYALMPDDGATLSALIERAEGRLSA